MCIYTHANRIPCCEDAIGLALSPPGQPHCSPVQAQRPQDFLAGIGQLVQVETEDLQLAGETDLEFLYGGHVGFNVRRIFRPKIDHASVPHAVDRECKRSAVYTGEIAGEYHWKVTVVSTIPTPLNDVEVTRKSFVQRTGNFFLQFDGIQFRRDLRGDHETLRFARCVAITLQQLRECLSPRLHICILER